MYQQNHINFLLGCADPEYQCLGMAIHLIQLTKLPRNLPLKLIPRHFFAYCNQAIGKLMDDAGDTDAYSLLGFFLGRKGITEILGHLSNGEHCFFTYNHEAPYFSVTTDEDLFKLQCTQFFDSIDDPTTPDMVQWIIDVESDLGGLDTSRGIINALTILPELEHQVCHAKYLPRSLALMHTIVQKCTHAEVETRRLDSSVTFNAEPAFGKELGVSDYTAGCIRTILCDYVLNYMSRNTEVVLTAIYTLTRLDAPEGFTSWTFGDDFDLIQFTDEETADDFDNWVHMMCIRYESEILRLPIALNNKYLEMEATNG